MRTIQARGKPGRQRMREDPKKPGEKNTGFNGNVSGRGKGIVMGNVKGTASSDVDCGNGIGSDSGFSVVGSVTGKVIARGRGIGKDFQGNVTGIVSGCGTGKVNGSDEERRRLVRSTRRQAPWC